ncbi:glycosyltransferase [Clostridium perfringens]|uniref:glycosyltransferase n=1 Tax=Clostridium perfringens TaxID=1502 RepID=UPI002AC4DB6E|nr:glycosyltransferase [Clostridium perfringens]MDZ5005563.1 glycosyltransferase [Clostridium perfringens]
MKVLLVNTFFEPNDIGGTEIFVKRLYKGLKEKNVDVKILSFDKDLNSNENSTAEHDIYRIKLKKFDLKSRVNKKGGKQKFINKLIEFNNREYRNEFSKILKEFKPDIIHINNIYGVSCEIWEIANRYSVPIIQTIHDYWTLCPRATLINGKLEKCAKRKKICKVYSEVFNKKAKYIKTLVFPSYSMKKIFEKQNMYLNNNKIVISNFLNINYDYTKKIIEERMQIESNKIKYVYVGRLEKVKGIELLIDIFSRNSDKELYVCGNGNKEIVRKIKGINNIKYYGSVDEETRDSILKKSDILIVPSLWEEPFGLVLIEAMRMGCIPIVSQNGALPEIAFDKDFQVFYDKEELSEKIKSIKREEIKNRLNLIIDKLMEYDINYRINDYVHEYNNLIKNKEF